MLGLGVPSKTYNLLALGKPILYIGDPKSELDILIKENNIGWSFNWEEEAAIIEFLNGLSITSNKIGENALEVAKSNYTIDIINSKIEKVILNEH